MRYYQIYFISNERLESNTLKCLSALDQSTAIIIQSCTTELMKIQHHIETCSLPVPKRLVTQEVISRPICEENQEEHVSLLVR